MPYNQYGWSKLSAECAVRMLKNHLVLRTRFFDSKEIPYENSANDIFTSSIEIKKLVLAINQLAFIDLKGVINIGEERLSDYDRYKKFKTDLKICKRDDIIKI